MKENVETLTKETLTNWFMNKFIFRGKFVNRVELPVDNEFTYFAKVYKLNSGTIIEVGKRIDRTDEFIIYTWYMLTIGEDDEDEIEITEIIENNTELQKHLFIISDELYRNLDNFTIHERNILGWVYEKYGLENFLKISRLFTIKPIKENLINLFYDKGLEHMMKEV